MKIGFSYGGDDGVVVRMGDYTNLFSIPQKQIEDMIREGVKNILANNQDFWYTQTGNTLVLITWEDEMTLFVSVATPRQYGAVDVPTDDLSSGVRRRNLSEI